MRKRIANSEWLNRGVVTVLALWIRSAYKTSKWDRVGFEDMEKALQSGDPIIIVTWHQRIMMAPYLFDISNGPICTFTSSSRAGTLAGRVVERFGLGTIAMSSHKRNIALTREVLRLMRQGASIGIAADGPRGPARVAKATPLTWARASGKRVFVVSFSARRVHTLSTWDQMWFPALWTKGVFCCREWETPLPRFSNDEEQERLRQSLEDALEAITNHADEKAGRPDLAS